jgi:hypothetical protein
MSVSEAAEELAEQFAKGNRTHVRDRIRSLPKTLAIGVALRTFDYLHKDDDEYLQRSFIRYMTDDL